MIGVTRRRRYGYVAPPLLDTREVAAGVINADRRDRHYLEFQALWVEGWEAARIRCRHSRSWNDGKSG